MYWVSRIHCSGCCSRISFLSCFTWTICSRRKHTQHSPAASDTTHMGLLVRQLPVGWPSHPQTRYKPLLFMAPSSACETPSSGMTRGTRSTCEGAAVLMVLSWLRCSGCPLGGRGQRARSCSGGLLEENPGVPGAAPVLQWGPRGALGSVTNGEAGSAQVQEEGLDTALSPAAPVPDSELAKLNQPLILESTTIR